MLCNRHREHPALTAPLLAAAVGLGGVREDRALPADLASACTTHRLSVLTGDPCSPCWATQELSNPEFLLLFLKESTQFQSQCSADFPLSRQFLRFVYFVLPKQPVFKGIGKNNGPVSRTWPGLQQPVRLPASTFSRTSFGSADCEPEAQHSGEGESGAREMAPVSAVCWQSPPPSRVRAPPRPGRGTGPVWGHLLLSSHLLSEASQIPLTCC